MNKQWITDRLPTAADADKDGNVYFEDANGYRSLCPWASPALKGRPWLPLNDLPPVPPKPKTQEQLDWELWNTPRIQANNTRGAIHAFANAIREDLKRQVRELIYNRTYDNSSGGIRIDIITADKLRELVKEDKQ